MANEAYKAGEGALWIQPDGPNTTPQYLGCHGIGDIAKPRGDVTLLYCPDRKAAGRFIVSGSFQSAPGPVTAQVTTKVFSVADYLEGLNCPVSVYVAKMKTGRRDVFGNWERLWILADSIITTETLSNLMVMSPEEEGESMQAFDISALALVALWKVKGQRQSTSETEGLLDVSFLAEQICNTSNAPALDSCQVGYIVGKNVVGASANVNKTLNGGSTWAATAVDPFAINEAIAAVEVFKSTGTITRILVVRGTTDAGNPAEVAYSDNAGAAWTLANVGATNAQYAIGGDSLFTVDPYNIWLVTTGGYVYQSQDFGATWTTRDAGVASGAATLNAIAFGTDLVGLAGGVTNALIRTLDGGVSWAAITGPAAEAANAINTVAVLDANTAWIGYSSGTLYYTRNLQDSTPTWTLRALPVAATAITNLKFANSNVAYLTATIAGPSGVILRTWDGGYTWESLSVPTNAGLASVFVCSNNAAFAVGEPQSASAMIVKVS